MNLHSFSLPPSHLSITTHYLSPPLPPCISLPLSLCPSSSLTSTWASLCFSTNKCLFSAQLSHSFIKHPPRGASLCLVTGKINLNNFFYISALNHTISPCSINLSLLCASKKCTTGFLLEIEMKENILT